MRPVIVSALFGALLALGCDSASGPSSPEPLGAAVFTADEGATTMSRIDLSTGSVTAIDIGVEPHNAQATAAGDLVLAVGIGDHSHGAGESGMLIVHDAAAPSGEHRAEIEAGDHPAHVVANAQGSTAFVTDSEQNTVVVIDLNGKSVLARIPTARYPHGLRMSPDGRELFVACVEDGVVSVIDVDSRRETDRISVGTTPVQVAFTPDGSRAYVTLRDLNAVVAIDTRTHFVIDTIAVGRAPIQLFVTPDGHQLVVANQGTESAPDSTVSIISVSSGTVVSTVTTGAGAHGVTISNDGRFAYIANQFANTVSEIDLADFRVTRTFSVGARPNGITYRRP